MKLLCLLFAAIPLSMAAFCDCQHYECPTITQPAACECRNRVSVDCWIGCNLPGAEDEFVDCPAVYGPPVRCGTKGLAACPSDLPWCLNSPEDLAKGCTIASGCPGYCVKDNHDPCSATEGCNREGATCVDDPSDKCNPKKGGVDCPQVCVYFKG